MSGFFRGFWQDLWREPEGKFYGSFALSVGLVMLLLTIYTRTSGRPHWEDPLANILRVYFWTAVPFAFVLYGLAALLPRTWRNGRGATLRGYCG